MHLAFTKPQLLSRSLQKEAGKQIKYYAPNNKLQKILKIF